MNLINAVLALDEQLPPIGAAYEYVLAGNGLFIRARDARMIAMVPVAGCALQGLVDVHSYAGLVVPRIPEAWLHSILESTRRHMPKEVIYQFTYSDAWRCVRPRQAVTQVSVNFADEAESVVDLHSHNSMSAFFSSTDDGDEQGLRFYCVVGRLDIDKPEIACRVGVYGYHMAVPVETVFEGPGPFVDILTKPHCRECGCTDEQGCPEGCYWVEPDLCSSCAGSVNETQTV